MSSADEDAQEFLLRTGHPWVNSDFATNCFACNGAFSLFNRKHHCRSCGNVFCGDCSIYSARINGVLKRACMRCSANSIAADLQVHQSPALPRPTAKDFVTGKVPQWPGPGAQGHVKRRSSLPTLSPNKDDATAPRPSELAMLRERASDMHFRPLPPTPDLANRPLPPTPTAGSAPHKSDAGSEAPSEATAEVSPDSPQRGTDKTPPAKNDEQPASEAATPSKEPSGATPQPGAGADHGDAGAAAAAAAAASPMSPRKKRVGSERQCARCRLRLSGPYLTLLDRRWHVDCVTCVDCGRSLVDQELYTSPYENHILDDLTKTPKLFCDKDYALRFEPRCGKCHTPVFNEDAVNALDQLFHLRCFVCAHCHKPLDQTENAPDTPASPRSGGSGGSVRYYEHGGQVYCHHDWQELFADRCAGCNFPIAGRSILALGKKWHDECFVCNECEQPVSHAADDGATTLEFFQVDHLIFCSRHRTDFLNPKSTKESTNTAATPEQLLQQMRQQLRPTPKLANVGAVSTSRGPPKPSEIRTQNKGTFMPTRRGSASDMPSTAEIQRRAAMLASPTAAGSGTPRRASELEEYNHNTVPVTINDALPLALQSIVNESSASNSAQPTSVNDFSTHMQYRIYVQPSSADSAEDERTLRFELAGPPVADGGKPSAANLGGTDYFDFEEYAPAVFADIRRRAGISNADFVRSLGVERLLGGQVGEGKSGMMFFFSPDSQYVIKTVKGSETQFLAQVLQDYHSHIVQNFTDTLLCKFLGLYKVKLRDQTVARLIVMNNIFYIPTSVGGVEMREMYDLKGSFSGRLVTNEELSRGVRTLKELNFCDKHDGTDPSGAYVKAREGPCRALPIGPARKEALKRAIICDTEWLTQHNVMDYSLLMGIAQADSPPKTARRIGSNWSTEAGGIVSKDENNELTAPCHVFYFGIVDILQEFTLRKKLESAYKGQLQSLFGQDPNMISALPPPQYAARFVNYVTSHFV